MSAIDVVLGRLDARRAVLMDRLQLVLEMEACGEGSTTRLELELIADEMRHLLDVYGAVWAETVR